MPEPTTTVDWVARAISIAGLSLALIVALVQVANFRRQRHDSPGLSIAPVTSVIIGRGNLLAFATSVYNRSSKPNTLVRLEVAAVHWQLGPLFFGRSPLAVADLSLDQTGRGLAILPGVALTDAEWRAVFNIRAQSPGECVWKLPVQIREASPLAIVICVAWTGEDRKDLKRLSFKMIDIYEKRHTTSLRLDPSVDLWH